MADEEDEREALKRVDAVDLRGAPGGVIHHLVESGERVSRPRRARGEACLVEFYGDQVGRRIDLPDGPATIGRVDEADLVVAHSSVSRQHARLTPTPKGYVVRDLGSTNGTYVNDRPVEEAPLHHGDYLRVGNAVFLVLSCEDLDGAYAHEIRRMSRLDGLTRTLRAVSFRDTADAWLEMEQPVSLVLLTVEEFHRMRAMYGELAAQNVVSLVASVLRKRTRQTDVLGRVGGCTFGLLLTDSARELANEVADKMRRYVALSSFRYEDAAVPITLATTVVSGRPGQHAESLIRRGAAALKVELFPLT